MQWPLLGSDREAPDREGTHGLTGTRYVTRLPIRAQSGVAFHHRSGPCFGDFYPGYYRLMLSKPT